MTDQDLIRGIIRRDPGVFREVVDRYQQTVIRTCYSLVHDQQDARDLAQDVFIEVLESAGRFRGEAQLSTWIYRIAVNKSLNHLRKMKRRQVFEATGLRPPTEGGENIPEDPASGSASPDSGMEEKEMREALHHAVNRLPVNQRIAFTLHKYEELSYKDIAGVMNISLSSVESLMHRARINLQNILRHYYNGNA